MERLTKWLNDKKNLCIKECEKECVEKYTECHKCEPFKDVMKRLAEYEDAEEQGLLLRLPCKVGTSVYMINHYWIDEGRICGIAEADDIDCFCYKVYCDPDDYTMVAVEEFNKTWFLTYEEAELELANRQQSHAESIMDERNGR